MEQSGELNFSVSSISRRYVCEKFGSLLFYIQVRVGVYNARRYQQADST